MSDERALVKMEADYGSLGEALNANSVEGVRQYLTEDVDVWGETMRKAAIEADLDALMNLPFSQAATAARARILVGAPAILACSDGAAFVDTVIRSGMLSAALPPTEELGAMTVNGDEILGVHENGAPASRFVCDSEGVWRFDLAFSLANLLDGENEDPVRLGLTGRPDATRIEALEVLLSFDGAKVDEVATPLQ